MNEDKRISLEYAAESLEGSLIRSAKQDGPDQTRRAKILGGLGIPPAAMISEPPASMSAAPAGAGKAVAGKWLLIGVLSAAIPVTAWLLWPKVGSEEPARTGPIAAPALAPTAEPPVVEREGTDTSNTPIVAAESLPVENEARAAAAARPEKVERKLEAEPVESGEDTLRAELAKIQHARATLSAGNATGALQELDAYRQTFPNGRLSQEATVLRIEALVKQGRREQAKALSKPFLAGKSPYAARVRSLLGE